MHQEAAGSAVIPASYVDAAAVPKSSTTFPQPGDRGGQEKFGASQNSAAAVAAPPEHLSSDQQFQHVLDRLKKLGATYYWLEAWGDQEHEYRFFCRMAVGGNPHVTRPFYSVDSDPVKAMNQVLQQVKNWQDGGVNAPRSAWYALKMHEWRTLTLDFPRDSSVCHLRNFSPLPCLGCLPGYTLHGMSNSLETLGRR